MRRPLSTLHSSSRTSQSQKIAMKWLLLILALVWCCPEGAKALSAPKNNPNPTSETPQSRSGLFNRRQLLKLPLGIAGTYGYGRLVYNALSVRDIKYPETHERRVEATIRRSLLAAVPANSSISSNRPLRVLEIGIGTECRLLRRGLYNPAFRDLVHENKGIEQIDLTGVDIDLPDNNIVTGTRRQLDKIGADESPRINLEVTGGSITDGLSFADGYFDSIVCCLVLCSVTDQIRALQEMKRLLRPDGGTLGYVEHVAVDEQESYKFLEGQQKILDPLQQAVAHNCHLHRYTEKAIDTTFGSQSGEPHKSSERLQHERFIVDSMWPVSCQCCGVIQRTL
jgi:SAM-dependent methyltransferase